MKKIFYSLVFVAISLACSNVSHAQFVGTVGSANIYLPGQYLEIGINNVGAFGAAETTGFFSYSVPAGYYPYPASSPLAEVYDYGHDGWTTGSPAYYGDYTYPGSPFEGWELQIAGVNSQAFTNGIPATISTFGGGDLTGNNISYVSAGGQLIGNWSGTASGGNLTVDMATEVDTFGNTVNVTVIMRNISTTTPVSNIYYMRSCDPDNDEAHGGSFATNNTIVHQNELPDHAVEVDAEGMLYDDHWSLCTKDCRAVAFVYESWPLSSSTDLGTVWNETYGTGGGFFGGAQYTLGGTLDGDYAIGLVFNVGTINPGDSAVVAYAYVFNDTYSTIDSAFPDPVLVVNGIPAPNAPIPEPTIDTFDACAIVGLTSAPVNILNATTGTWTWSQWNWAPATGLATTTGVTNTINLTVIPGWITYTITGTDSASNGFTCNNKTFYLTVHACNCDPIRTAAFSDEIHLGCNGDSVFFVNGSTPPGMFQSYWNFGDASSIDSVDTNPIHIYADGSTGIGTYTVTLIYGADSNSFCNDTVSQTITFNHPLSASFTLSADTVCLGTPISFTNTSIANSPTYQWNFSDGSGISDSLNATHTYGGGGLYNVVLTVTDNTPCVATATQTVDIIAVDVHTGVHDTSVCLTDSMSMHAFTIVSGGIDSVTYAWTPTNNLGEPNDSVTNFFGVGTFQYLVTATTYPLGCNASDTETIYSYPPVTFTDVTASTTIASGSNIMLNADGAVYYTWTPDDGTLSNPNINNPIARPLDSVTTYVVHGMNLYGCLDSASVTITLTYPTPEFVPSAFSPNHDGLNDVLKVGNMQESKLVDFRVFNRWGQVIFQTANSEEGWDGTFNGTPQDIGSYNYLIIITHPDGVQQTMTGTVTLIR